MMKTILNLLPLLALIAAAGCSNEVPSYREGRAERYAPPQVQITGLNAEDLRRSTAIDRPSTYRDSANLLFVTVPVRNTSPGVTVTLALTWVIAAASAAVTPGHSPPPFRTIMGPMTVPVPPSVPPLVISHPTTGAIEIVPPGVRLPVDSRTGP